MDEELIAPAPAPVDAPAPTPEVAASPAPVTAPAPAPTMLDAINAALEPKDANGQPRDPLGRFAPKDAAGNPVPAPAATPAAAAPVVPGATPPVKPAVPGADDLAMPEGLQPKAQERFQKLAESVKTVTAERDEARGQVGYMRETFQKHGVRQDQFEQAVGVIGMLNAGDYQGALKVLDEQRRQIALLTGQPLPGVDALSEHPDLRQAVDGLQINERDALELARSRTMQAQQQRQQQEQRQAQQSQRQEQQAVQTALNDVDTLVKNLQATDIDFDAIEAQLRPAIKDLLAGVPPHLWKNAVQTQYSLLKRTAASFRSQASPQSGGVLRPTGLASPGSTPRTMMDAMFPTR